MHRRRFLQAGVVGAPAVFGGGLSTVLAPADEEDGLHTRATSGRGLGVQRVVWSGPGDGVALTFDDGPDPELTTRVLDALDRAAVRATFLVVGMRVVAEPDLVRRVVDAGHEVGNHTWSHRSLATLEADDVRAELGRTADALARVVPDAPVRFFRPPRGILTGAATQAAAELGYDVLLWSCTFSHLDRPLPPGTVACLHDGTGRAELDGRPASPSLRAQRQAEVDALPAVLARAQGDRVRFVTASELSGDP